MDVGDIFVNNNGEKFKINKFLYSKKCHKGLTFKYKERV